MIRTIDVREISKNIKEMCIEANHYLSKDMDTAMKQAEQDEKSPLGKQILGQLQENLKIAADDMIPICQDTGMAVIFLEIGQDVHLEGGLLEEAVNEGVRQGYTEGFLRKSVVKDPLIRENTKDNTPAVLHTKIVAGDKVKIKVAPKGFGSENMSRVFMLKPAEGIEGVKHAILTAVRDAGPNACPPMVVGVGIGGTFEKCALMAKEALTLKKEIEMGIDSYAVRNLEGIGETYVYETDGYGNDVWMDDANVPNLLSMPWLGWCDASDERYQNTRKWVLSSKNPFYYEGTAAKGIGSPHTPAGYIWHIALAMQGLTSNDEEEKTSLMQTLLATDAGTRLMHEGFNSNDPTAFTREWFAWANSLFALYAMEYCGLTNRD